MINVNTKWSNKKTTVYVYFQNVAFILPCIQLDKQNTECNICMNTQIVVCDAMKPNHYSHKIVQALFNFSLYVIQIFLQDNF